MVMHAVLYQTKKKHNKGTIMLSLLGLLAGLGLLIVLTMRGFNLFITAPLCALLVAATNGIPFWQVSDQSCLYIVGGR